MSLGCQNAFFDIPSDVTYLNNAFMGAIPRPVREAGERALKLRAEPWNLSAVNFFEPAETVRAMAAQLLNTNADSIAFVPNVAHAIATIAKNLRLLPGQNIVLLDEQFPSNVYAWRKFKAHGVELRMIGVAAGPHRSVRWTEEILKSIDANTALVSIEPAHWTDGSLFDLVAIGKKCREVDACFVVDATQTAGIEPLDVVLIQADAVVVHAYKSLLSNYGLGFAYFGPRFRDAEPLEESWLMRHGSEDFARLVDYQDHYAAGMRRFDTSLRSNPSLIMMLQASLELFQQWQVPRIKAYCQQISLGFVERLQAAGFDIPQTQEHAANLFGIRPRKELSLEALRLMLQQEKIFVSIRGSAIRVSPHVYSQASDLERLERVLLKVS